MKPRISSMTRDRYTLTAVRLHWLIAVLIFTAFCVGLYMTGLPFSPRKLQIYSWHKWCGVTIFLLVAIRLAWRTRHAPPALPASMPMLHQKLAKAMHHLLYMLMFAVPVLGWLMSSAKGFQTVYFGVLPLPDLLEKNKALGDALASIHGACAWTLVIVALGHAAVAIKHHVVDRDDVLVRMLPFLKTRPLPAPMEDAR